MLSRRRLTLTLAGLLAAGGALALDDEPLLWVSGEVPPFLSRGAHGPQGYAFDLYQRVCRQAELDGELRFYPWARAMRMLTSRQAQVGLVVARSPDREARFQWLFPVGNFHLAAFTRPEDGPTQTEFEALRSRRVGSLRASASRELLASAGMTNVVEAKDYPELLALLQRRVVDVVIGPEHVMRSLLADQHPSPPPRSTVLDRSLHLYAAGGPALPEDVRHRLIAAYQQLVDNGTVAQLKKRHPDAFFDD